MTLDKHFFFSCPCDVLGWSEGLFRCLQQSGGHQRAAVHYKRGLAGALTAHSIILPAEERRSLLPQSQWNAASWEFSACFSFARLDWFSARWSTDIAQVPGSVRRPETPRWIAADTRCTWCSCTDHSGWLTGLRKLLVALMTSCCRVQTRCSVSQLEVSKPLLSVHIKHFCSVWSPDTLVGALSVLSDALLFTALQVSKCLFGFKGFPCFMWQGVYVSPQTSLHQGGVQYTSCPVRPPTPVFSHLSRDLGQPESSLSCKCDLICWTFCLVFRLLSGGRKVDGHIWHVVRLYQRARPTCRNSDQAASSIQLQKHHCRFISLQEGELWAEHTVPGRAPVPGEL